MSDLSNEEKFELLLKKYAEIRSQTAVLRTYTSLLVANLALNKIDPQTYVMNLAQEIADAIDLADEDDDEDADEFFDGILEYRKDYASDFEDQILEILEALETP